MVSPECAALNDRLRAVRERQRDSGALPSLGELRELMESAIERATEPEGVATTAVAPGGCPSLLHEPESVGGPGVLLHCHGGGFAVGSPLAWSRFLGHLALRSGWSVLNLGYRLAPEHPFPAALEDTRAAVEWLMARGRAADAIVLGGDSAGGALALGTAQRMRDEGVTVGGCVLLSPWVDLTLTNPSVEANAETDPVTSAGLLTTTRELYVGDADPADPRISPGLGEMSGLPPLHIQAASTELLSDDATRLADRARAAGVEVELKLWDDVPHVHQLYVGALPEADESVELIARWLGGRAGSSQV